MPRFRQGSLCQDFSKAHKFVRSTGQQVNGGDEVGGVGALPKILLLPAIYPGELSCANRHLNLQIAMHIYKGAAARAPSCIGSQTFCPPLL